MSDYPILVKRIYSQPEESDGTRVLVDRLWPRGVSKERARLDEWLKTVAPSTELREWYGHIPDRFDEFSERYSRELEGSDQKAALLSLRSVADRGPLTLLTAAKAPEISEAAVLAKILSSRPMR